MAQRVRKIKHIKLNSSTYSIIYSSNGTSIKHLLGSVVHCSQAINIKYTHNPNESIYIPL